MRGKATRTLINNDIVRITPAYAGKRLETASLIVRNQDHPRLCGEKSHFVKCSRSFTGSPPPMRGKVFHKRIDLYPIRITPAYAGKSSGGFRVTLWLGDHPRLCGEKFGINFNPFTYMGSPPPMRGKDLPIIEPENIIRITPAYAGKSRL